MVQNAYLDFTLIIYEKILRLMNCSLKKKTGLSSDVIKGKRRCGAALCMVGKLSTCSMETAKFSALWGKAWGHVRLAGEFRLAEIRVCAFPNRQCLYRVV
ncbi:hypothetical protein IKQ19_18405, partial [Candidatus Saccharibacteria bacterium]|nr:hypothetical protein [Candidatus Saccharibacteria bacterium]